MQPLVSIIIPSFNRAHLLGATLESILLQTYQNWECIVVDDESNDVTDELMRFYCEKDSRIQYYEREKNLPKGANSCRNFGFDLSKGDYIIWFDSDDIMLPDYLEVLINSFKDCVQCVICSGYYTNENLKKRIPIVISKNIDLYKEYLIWNQQILICSVIFRRSFLENKELFNPTITRGQEAELFSRLFYKLSKNQYFVEPGYHFLYRQHSKTVSSLNQHYNRSYKRSEAYVYIENLRRSLNIKDEELFEILGKRLINLFFRGLENKHVENSRYILNNIYPIFLEKHRFFGLEILFVGRLLIHFKKESYRVERRWKSKRITNISGGSSETINVNE